MPWPLYDALEAMPDGFEKAAQALETGKIPAGPARDKLELEVMVYLVQQQCRRLDGEEVPAWVVPILERDEAGYEAALLESGTAS